MEIKPFPKVLPDDNYVFIAESVHLSEEDKEDPFVPQTESHGYPTGVDEQQTAAGCATLHEACCRATNQLDIERLGLWLSPPKNAQD